jgi:hypothetical protein
VSVWSSCNCDILAISCYSIRNTPQSVKATLCAHTSRRCRHRIPHVIFANGTASKNAAVKGKGNKIEQYAVNHHNEYTKRD